MTIDIIEAAKADRQSPRQICKAIIEMCAKKHRVHVRDVMSRYREYRIVRARQEAMAIIRSELGWSYPHIASVWGMEHTTVRHGVRKHHERAEIERGAALSQRHATIQAMRTGARR